MQKLLAVFFILSLWGATLQADTLSFYVLQNSNNQIDFRDTTGLKINGSGAMSFGIEMGTQLYPNVDWFLGLRYNSTRSFSSGSNNAGTLTLSPTATYDSTLFYYKVRWNFINNSTFSSYVGAMTGFDFSSQKNFPGAVNADVGAAWGLLGGIKLLDSWRLEAGQLWMLPTFRGTGSAFAAIYQESYLSAGYEMNFDFVGLFKR